MGRVAVRAAERAMSAPIRPSNKGLRTVRTWYR